MVFHQAYYHKSSSSATNDLLNIYKYNSTLNREFIIRFIAPCVCMNYPHLALKNLILKSIFEIQPFQTNQFIYKNIQPIGIGSSLSSYTSSRTHEGIYSSIWIKNYVRSLIHLKWVYNMQIDRKGFPASP